MSYSFRAQASTKVEAGKAVDEKLSEVVVAQPIHELDRQFAQDTAESALNLLRDDDTQDVSVSISGSCSNWNTPDGLNQISLTVSVQTIARAAS